MLSPTPSQSKTAMLRIIGLENGTKSQRKPSKNIKKELMMSSVNKITNKRSKLLRKKRSKLKLPHQLPLKEKLWNS